MTDPIDTESQIASEYVSHSGTAYTLQVQRVHEQDNVAFAQRDISTPFTIYSVFTGPDMHSHHDKHHVGRQLPGDSRWILDEFDRLEAELNNN